ncbi:hypothetical protein FQN57_000583 [Myotisia sp. PD_48]|nr:hypothetical protein FQN57_000583 [Myotisia sp. PD_48]
MTRRRNHPGPSHPPVNQPNHAPSNPLKKPTDMSHSKWLTLALASGAFAALNGLFAKLYVPHFILAQLNARLMFFGLNLLSNFIMWALFTRALTASPSTTKVTITNTTSNFLVTALLGMIVFQEKVTGQWIIGAVLMAGGCIVVGLREEKEQEESVTAQHGVDADTENIRLAGDATANESDESEDDSLITFRDR